MAISLRRALGLRRGGRGVDEVAGAVIGRPGRDEVVRGPVRRDPPRRASRLARVPRPVHSSIIMFCPYPFVFPFFHAYFI
jgi:hypothetical protein